MSNLERGLVSAELVRTGAQAKDKNDAIAQAAQLLIAAGCIETEYLDSMLRREAIADTFLGFGVAIPHGQVEDRHLVRKNGIAVLQIPEGLVWNDGQTVYLVVAIAAQSDAHIDVLKRLTRLIQDESKMAELRTTQDGRKITEALLDDASNKQPAPNTEIQDYAHSFKWAVNYPSGLHARPAQRWAAMAREFNGSVQVRSGRLAADGKNLAALLALGLRENDEVVISVDGEEANSFLNRLRKLIAELSEDEIRAAKAQEAAAAKQSQGWQTDGSPDVQGIGASPGLAIGKVFRLNRGAMEIPDTPVALQEGGEKLHHALASTRMQLASIADDTRRRLGASDAAIFEAQAELLNDSDLITLACQLLVQGHGLAWSWHTAVEQTASGLAAQENSLLAARAVDLRDVGQRVLAQIDPALVSDSLGDIPEGSILFAEDLVPSDTANLDTTKVVGLATVVGGPTSHTAILARTLGLPALVAGGEALAKQLGASIDHESNTEEAILDGHGGRLYLQPSAEMKLSAQTWQKEEAAKHAREASERRQPATTTDGKTIDIGANVNMPDQVSLALDQGAEGVGLMRTEFLFLERGNTPTEDEQYDVYLAIAKALKGKPLIVRALDIGGDKQVPHLNLPKEENPFLGMRGARLLLRRQDLLIPQLRALYRAAADGARLSIMFPMISSLAELTRLRGIAEAVRTDVNAPEVPIGIMIEVPAAAAMADLLAQEADFFSVGTNDLTQYTLAMDRQNPDLAAEADSLHPAVLRMIQQTVAGARKHNRWVGVCGGLAGDPFGARLLAGLGVNELSMTPRDIPSVKAALRDSSHEALKALADKALACASADAVRALDSITASKEGGEK